jgi:transcriptional regulator GlxA family with amidase domain
VDTDPIYVRDGEVWTSAGVTASFDLPLAVIEQDHGADAARFAARALVLYCASCSGSSTNTPGPT